MNYTNTPIYAGYSEAYPDSSIILFDDSLTVPERQDDRDSTVYIPHLASWDTFFKQKDSTFKLIIFVFDANTIENIKWNKIVKDYTILKRYEFTYDEIRKINWAIKFP